MLCAPPSLDILACSVTRPQVWLNFASTIDGKISTAAREKVRFTSRSDRRHMEEIRAACDAVLIGAGTLRAEDPPLHVRAPDLRERRRREGRDPSPINVVLSCSLELPVGGRFFGAPGVRRIIATVEEAPEDKARRLAEVAEILRVGHGRVAVSELLKKLAERGVARLLVEGGGETNALFLEEDCVDEIHVTLAPVVIGGRDAPSPVEGSGFANGRFPAFELAGCRVESNEVFLHYRRR